MEHKYKSTPLLLTLLLALALPMSSWSQVSATKLQAAMLLTSVKYMEWPSDDRKDFVILILGGDDIYNEIIGQSASRKIGARDVIIKKVASIADVKDCNIVIVDPFKTNQIKKLSAQLNGSGTLIVSNDDRAIDLGSDFNFSSTDGKLSFQLNERSIDTKKIKVSIALKSLSKRS
jgi:hypothetical protein